MGNDLQNLFLIPLLVMGTVFALTLIVPKRTVVWTILRVILALTILFMFLPGALWTVLSFQWLNLYGISFGFAIACGSLYGSFLVFRSIPRRAI